MFQYSNRRPQTVILLIALAGVVLIIPQMFQPQISNSRRSKNAKDYTACPQIDIASNSSVSTKQKHRFLLNHSSTSYWTRDTASPESRTAESWTYHYQSELDGPYQTIRVPNKEPYTQYDMSSVLESATDTSTSVVFYGSSHLRAMYFSLVRLERGNKFNGPLEEEITSVGSGASREKQSESCDPKHSGYVSGKYGIDLKGCGLPRTRTVPELYNGDKAKVAIGFKTFLHTPDAEQAFVDFLSENDLRHPTVLVVDMGIWGTRGSRMAGADYPNTQKALKPEEEVDYYFNWIETTFPTSKVVYVVERNVKVSMELLDKMIIPKILKRVEETTKGPSVQASFMIRKDLILETVPKTNLPCNHGCEGPVTTVLATLLLDWLSEVTTNAYQKCFGKEMNR